MRNSEEACWPATFESNREISVHDRKSVMVWLCPLQFMCWKLHLQATVQGAGAREVIRWHGFWIPEWLNVLVKGVDKSLQDQVAIKASLLPSCPLSSTVGWRSMKTLSRNLASRLGSQTSFCSLELEHRLRLKAGTINRGGALQWERHTAMECLHNGVPSPGWEARGGVSWRAHREWLSSFQRPKLTVNLKNLFLSV